MLILCADNSPKINAILFVNTGLTYRTPILQSHRVRGAGRF